MWLDRLAGHASPAIHSPSNSTTQSQRSYSPAGAAGRRPTHLQQQHSQQGSQRPIYGPRSSSLTSASNDSNISLLGYTQQKPNGSNLRQVSRPDDSQDPLKLLDRLLGSTPKPEEDDAKDHEKELALEDIDFEGLSLSDFVKTDKPVQRQRSQSIVECQYIVLTYALLSSLQFTQTSKTSPNSMTFMTRYVLAMKYLDPWNST